MAASRLLLGPDHVSSPGALCSGAGPGVESGGAKRVRTRLYWIALGAGTRYPGFRRCAGAGPVRLSISMKTCGFYIQRERC